MVVEVNCGRPTWWNLHFEAVLTSHRTYMRDIHNFKITPQSDHQSPRLAWIDRGAFSPYWLATCPMTLHRLYKTILPTVFFILQYEILRRPASYADKKKFKVVSLPRTTVRERFVGHGSMVTQIFKVCDWCKNLMIDVNLTEWTPNRRKSIVSCIRPSLFIWRPSLGLWKLGVASEW